LNNKEDLNKLKEFASKNKLKLLALYTYDLSKQPKSKAVRFVYLLKGRGNSVGLISELSGRFLAPGCFILPIKKDKEMQEIFSFWKISFKRNIILMN